MATDVSPVTVWCFESCHLLHTRVQFSTNVKVTGQYRSSAAVVGLIQYSLELPPAEGLDWNVCAIE
jgi:hypothetical protein